jgi:putative flippase GtrA
MSGLGTQIGKFGIIGVINTIIDFGIFNFLTGGLKLHKIPSNICSTTVAMIFSFIANRDAVFHAGSGNPFEQGVLFFAVTGFGLYVLQTGVFYMLLDYWAWPQRLVARAVRRIDSVAQISTDFALRNSVKVCGTIVSLVWNFILYKYVVFR